MPDGADDDEDLRADTGRQRHQLVLPGHGRHTVDVNRGRPAQADPGRCVRGGRRVVPPGVGGLRAGAPTGNPRVHGRLRLTRHVRQPGHHGRTLCAAPHTGLRPRGATMQFTVTETIDAPREDVVRALAEPDYYAGLGDASTSVRAPELLSAETTGGMLRVQVRYAFAGTISGPAARVVDTRKLTWVIETAYDTTTHRGTLVVVPDHYDGMLRCDGTLALDEAGSGTLETVAGRLEVRVPLVSKAAERAIFGGFTTQLGREAVALAAWCAANPAAG